MSRLSASVPFHVREATGADELLVLEPGGSPAATVVALAARIAVDADGGTLAWEELPAAEVGVIALAIRQAWLGERIHTDARCPSPGCRERMDIAFTIPDYLAHYGPRPYKDAVPGPDAGWFELRADPELRSASSGPPSAAESPGARELAGAPEPPRDSLAEPTAPSGTGPSVPAVSFRLPTIGDLLAALASADPEGCLRERCVRPSDVPPEVAGRISDAMAALAPSLTDDVTVQCPACGVGYELRFDPVSYALTELRDAAAGLYEEIYLLASAFHWPEDAILALPRGRRARYAARIRLDRAAA